MGWITQFAMMTAAMAVPLAIGGRFDRWKLFLRCLSGIGLICGVYGIAQWLGWDPILPEQLRNQITAQFGGVYRPVGTIGHPVYFANCLMYAFFSSLALLIIERARALRVMAAGTLITAAVASSASRGALLGVAGGSLLFLTWALLNRPRTSSLSKQPASRGRIRAISSIIGIGLACVLALISIRFTVNVSQVFPATRLVPVRFREFGSDLDSIGRVIVWQDVFARVVPNTWITGAGPGMFRVAFAKYRSDNYGAFGPDVHWESAHNVFLDRLTEESIAGLFSFLALIGAAAHNILRASRTSMNSEVSAAYAAIGGGLVAVLIHGSFNGEVIPTTYYFYIWIALCFASPDSAERRSQDHVEPKAQSHAFGTLILVLALFASLCVGWYAYKNWIAETALADAVRASAFGDETGLLASVRQGQRAMDHVGTYHLEFAQLISGFLRNYRQVVSPQGQVSLPQTAVDSALWAVNRTDEPMRALLNLISLGDVTADVRTVTWLEQLEKIDPYWFRPHELSARLFLQQGRIEEALREATIARQLAPYEESAEKLWAQLNAIRRELGTHAGKLPVR
jgi:hypothetical protein